MQIAKAKFYRTPRSWSKYLERGPRYRARGAIDVAGLIAVVPSARFQRSCPERTPPLFAAEETRGWSCRRERHAWTSQSWLPSSWRLEGFRTRRELLSWMDIQSEGAQGEVWTSKEPNSCRASYRRGVEKASRRLRHVGCRRRPILRRLDPEDLPPIGQDSFNGYPWPGDWLNIVRGYSICFEILRHRLAFSLMPLFFILDTWTLINYDKLIEISIWDCFGNLIYYEMCGSDNLSFVQNIILHN